MGKVPDNLFTEIIEDVKKMKYTMPQKDIDVLIDYQIRQHVKDLNLSNDDKAILKFQLV
jgi:transcriptional regulator of met regulon